MWDILFWIAVIIVAALVLAAGVFLAGAWATWRELRRNYSRQPAKLAE